MIGYLLIIFGLAMSLIVSGGNFIEAAFPIIFVLIGFTDVVLASAEKGKPKQDDKI